ncbi:MAG: hypothetical protein J0M15_02035 [Deltaproteobacteria bacterium]|nr:hypothetical protein [Deltaproteobacteria bacterium]
MESKSQKGSRKLKRSDMITLRLDSHVEGNLFVDIQMMVNEANRTKLKAKARTGVKPRNRNKKYITALNCLLANLTESVLQELPIAIGHREDFYKKRTRPNPKQITAYIMKAVLKEFCDKNIGFVKLLRRGFHNKKNKKNSSLSLYLPTSDFDLFKRMATKSGNELFIRRSKPAGQSAIRAIVYETDKNDSRIYYDLEADRPDVVRTIQVLDKLDSVLQRSKFNIRTVSIEAPRFYRSFSPDYSKHGRIYSEGGSIQNWKKKFVRDLLIDDRPTVELDYSSTHTAIAYAIKGTPMPSKDVYILNTLRSIQDPDLKRKLGKAFTNIILNADSRKAAAQAIGKEFADQGIKYKTDLGISIPDVIAEITRRHEPIAEYFFSGAGLRLMKVESDICLEVVDRFAQLNKPIIPKHDSFIVKEEDENLLQQTMIDAWITVLSKIQEQKRKVQVPNISKKKDDSLF